MKALGKRREARPATLTPEAAVPSPLPVPTTLPVPQQEPTEQDRAEAGRALADALKDSIAWADARAA